MTTKFPEWKNMTENDGIMYDIDGKIGELRKLLQEVKLTTYQRKKIFRLLDNLKEETYKKKPEHMVESLRWKDD